MGFPSPSPSKSINVSSMVTPVVLSVAPGALRGARGCCGDCAVGACAYAGGEQDDGEREAPMSRLHSSVLDPPATRYVQQALQPEHTGTSHDSRVRQELVNNTTETTAQRLWRGMSPNEWRSSFPGCSPDMTGGAPLLWCPAPAVLSARPPVGPVGPGYASAPEGRRKRPYALRTLVGALRESRAQDSHLFCTRQER